MKKKVLKGWVEELLIALLMIGFVFAMSDADSMLAFVVSKFIAIIIMYPSASLLFRYGKDWR